MVSLRPNYFIFIWYLIPGRGRTPWTPPDPPLQCTPNHLLRTEQYKPLQVIQLSEYLFFKNRSFEWVIHPLFWLYASPLISYSVMVWFPLKGNWPHLLPVVPIFISFINIYGPKGYCMALNTVNFVCNDASHPSQQFFSHVGTYSSLPWLNQHFAEDTMSAHNIPVNMFTVMLGHFPVFLGWTSTKQRIKYLAHNIPFNMFTVMLMGHFSVFLGWTSTKQRIKYLAQRHNTMPPMILKLATLWSKIYHSTTAILSLWSNLEDLMSLGPEILLWIISNSN